MRIIFNNDISIVLINTHKINNFTTFIARREEHRLVHLLMTLGDDFEEFHGSILYHNSLPCVNLIINQLLVDDMHFKSQAMKDIFHFCIFISYFFISWKNKK